MKRTREILEAIVSGTPGAVGAGVIAMDGKAIDVVKVDAHFPLEAVNQEITTLTKLLIYMCRKLQAATFSDFMMSCERVTVLVAAPAPDRCVVVFLNGRANVGTARVQLRRHLPELAAISEAMAG
jgi:predicted regulator of Ras-like GTPase activity (Roadblock/LC7/MglB family)